MQYNRSTSWGMFHVGAYLALFGHYTRYGVAPRRPSAHSPPPLRPHVLIFRRLCPPPNHSYGAMIRTWLPFLIIVAIVALISHYSASAAAQ